MAACYSGLLLMNGRYLPGLLNANDHLLRRPGLLDDLLRLGLDASAPMTRAVDEAPESGEVGPTPRLSVASGVLEAQAGEVI